MNYKLAKELKDAGFPQAADAKGTLRKGGSYIFPEGISLATPKKKFNAAMAYAPTLEELIEACGNLFLKLENMTGGRWDASSIDVLETGGFRGTGTTPQGAVARLWLALNKKI